MVDAYGGDPEKQRAMPIQDRTMGKSIPPEMVDSLRQKNMNFFARRFFEEFYAGRAVDRTNISKEAEDLKKGFSDWHARIVSDFKDPMQTRFGEEIGNLQDLSFDHIVRYPEVEIQGIDEKIQESQKQGVDSQYLNLQRDQWQLRREIAQAALNPVKTEPSETLVLPTDEAPTAV